MGNLGTESYKIAYLLSGHGDITQLNRDLTDCDADSQDKSSAKVR